MIQVNPQFRLLRNDYLFSSIAQRLAKFQQLHPDVEIIRLGIGDVTRPLPPACLQAFQAAVTEMGDVATFRGYGPEQGYQFLRQAIAEGDFQQHNINISSEEIFISDGSKCDCANFQEIFHKETVVALSDPTYPVYADSNVIAGRGGQEHQDHYDGLVYLPATKANSFIPSPPEQPVDLVYLCFPNNPTGAVISRQQLRQWVDWARQNKALILYDAAYVQFIRDTELPRSIFEIEGAREVAVEFRSFSKSAGFTGVRCAYSVVPHECCAFDEQGQRQPVHPLWLRRHTTKFNGVAYPVQRAAAAVYSPEGQQQLAQLAHYYMTNADTIRHTLQELGWRCYGGEHSPYVWLDTAGEDSWHMFERLLNQAGVVTTPGTGFGREGRGYLRLSAFNEQEAVVNAMERLRKVLSAPA